MRSPRFIDFARPVLAPATEAAAGLAARPARLPPKFFYDALGSRLFDAITELPEYYPTRTEAAIFAAHRDEIAAAVHDAVGAGMTLVDLGAGSCCKAEALFGAFAPARYVAVDISVQYLRDNMHRAPVLVLPVFAGRPEGAGVFTQASMWGSIIQAGWSFMLALRARGLGSCWTTGHLNREAEMAGLLGIPDHYTQAGLFPVAYTLGTDFKAAWRKPVAEVLNWNGFAC